MQKIWFTLSVLLGAAITLIFLPSLALAIVLINALFAFLLAILQLKSAITPNNPKHISSMKGYEPFVSIHIPCHNEPYEVIYKTLKSISDLSYGNYEVLIIDNNTHDPLLWQPIKKYCETLGDKFHFYHYESLAGYKAGALNAALEHTDERAEVIAVIDADYIVNEDFLQIGVPYFQDEKVAIVQYPQDYYNITKGTFGIQQEYRSFFDTILTQANNWDAVTATGTLCLLRAKLFSKKSIQWNEWCITEDAELSIHLHGLGYKGIFINEVVGTGLMPFNYYSLQRQRERWVYGNTQIIKKDTLSILLNPKLNLKQKISFMTQLTAWIHPNLLPILYISISIFLGSVGMFSQTLVTVSWIGLITILAFIVAKILYFAIDQWKKGNASIEGVLTTTMSHFGLTNTMSFIWLWALTSAQLPFNRTTKDPREKTLPYIPLDIIAVFFYLALSSVAIFTAHQEITVIAITSAALGLWMLVSILFLSWEMNKARQAANTVLLD